MFSNILSEASVGMVVYYLSIEKNIEGFEFYKALWKARGIEGVRAGSMTEGIDKAVGMESSNDDELFFIDIVADDINFMPQLKMLSEETNAPILIAVSKPRYTEKEHHAALNSGADFYGQYCDDPEENINAVLSVINCINQRARKRKAPIDRISHGDIHIVIDYHKVFIEDVEIALTGMEMKIFQYLVINRGNTMSHRQIYSQISDGAFDEISRDTIYSSMKRLRKKIRDVAGGDYIETVRDVGYRLKTKREMQK